MKLGRLRVLHASLLSRIGPGPAGQLLLEHEASASLGIPWDTVVMSPSAEAKHEFCSIQKLSCSVSSLRCMPLIRKAWAVAQLRSEFYSWLSDVQVQYDLILIRYSVHDPFLWRFVNRRRVAVGTVHHSFELEELSSSGGLMGHARREADRIIGPSTLTKTDLLVGVTGEIVDYEAARAAGVTSQRLVYPNGASHDATPVADNRGNVPELLFMSSEFSYWHGLDVLLASASRSSQPFLLHVVGEVDPEIQYGFDGDSRIRFHGQLDTSRIRLLAESCHVALSAMALSRKGMSQACALKVREYLSMGLVTFGSHREVFPDRFEYYFQGEPTIEDALKFARLHRSTSRESVARAAQPLISKQSILEATYQRLTEMMLSA